MIARDTLYARELHRHTTAAYRSFCELKPPAYFEHKAFIFHLANWDTNLALKKKYSEKYLIDLRGAVYKNDYIKSNTLSFFKITVHIK